MLITENTNEVKPQECTSLAQLAAYKKHLKEDIEQDEKEMKKMWNSLFKKPSSTYKSPSQKLSNFLSMSGGIIDGALLGWKLYRKFKR